MNSKQLAGKSAHVELQRQKLQRMMHQFQDNFNLACEALTMVAHNLDFGEVKVGGSIVMFLSSVLVPIFS